MSRTVRLSRRLAAIAAALLVVVTASGCAAGQVSQTAQEVAAIDGANADVGKISVRNARFESPSGASFAPGADVPLLFWLSNTSLNPDTLSQLSSPLATQVVITGGKATVQGGSLAEFGSESAVKVVLKGLKGPLSFGTSVPVTFGFDAAGQVTTNVPVEIPAQRTGTRPTVDIQPAEPTPLWLTGEAGHAQVGESSAPATVAPTAPVSSAEPSVAASSSGG